MSKVMCNLCMIEFDSDDPLITNRKSIHESWHSKARIHKRNTTQGIVTWIS